MSENGEAQNETPSESDKMDISEVSDQVSPVSDQSEMVDNQRPAGAAQPVLLDNASAIAASPLASMMTTTTTTKTTGSTGGTTRGRLSSTLSLEGLDLELPSLDMYQEEYAEFPSSPKHLKERLEAHGLSMPLERDSGTTVDSAIQDADVNQVTLSENETQRSRRVLTPNPEDALLPALYGAMGDSTITVQSTTENDVKSSTNKSTIGNKSNVSHRGGKLNEDNNKRNMLLNVPVSDLLDEEDKSNFVFERRDSKRLTRKELGERIMEGLFVESRQKDQAASSGLRKISVPKDLELYASPTVEFQNSLKFEADVFQNPENEVLTNLNGHAERRARSQPNSLNDSYSSHEINGFGSHSDETNSSALKPQPAARKAAPPVPAARTSVSLTTPPCPKPRRKYEAARGLCLILDPAALESRTPRAVPKINPDGSVEVQEERPGSLVASQRGGRRKIQVSADILNGPAEEDNASSGDSRLSDTDMVSPDDDPDLDALLSPDLDTPDELEDSILERLGEPPPAPDPIPELSAAQERAEARSWRNCIVAGLERKIDMKVIEPYKRVLSHGGYLAAGSHNAIIVFSACFLPDRSRVDYDYVMDNLFLYVLTTLDQLITEDYVLIYLHGATARSCMPTFSWLKRCYQMIDRRLRKNLKGLYLVHPTFWLKTIVLMTRPFISSKFSRKLRFIESLAELAAVIPLEQASIPDRVKQLELDQQARSLKRRKLLPWWSPQTTAAV